MNTLLLLLALAADPESLASGAPLPEVSERHAAAVAETADTRKRFHEYEAQARNFMRREATARTQAERAEAIRELVGLYAELKSDPRLDASETLTGIKARLWSRLTSIKKDIERDLARQEANDRRAAKRNVDTSTGEKPGSASEALAAELSLATLSLGGPSAVAGQSGAFGGGGIPDYGQTLVDLIERVIAPDKWDTVGGPFSMVYYSPLRVLVVSATDEVHGNLSGLLDGLRRAGN